MNKTIVSLLLAGAAVCAQEPPKPEPPKSAPDVVRVYQVKPGNAQSIRNALCNIAICGSIQGDLLVIRLAPDLAPAVDALVPRLDSTPVDTRNIELTFYILQVSRQAIPDAGALPPALQPAVAQIKDTLAFQGIRLLDTGLVRIANRQKVETHGDLAALNGEYSFSAEPAVVRDTQPPSIRIDNLVLAAHKQGGNTVLRGSVDIKQGQKAVIGKTSLGADESLVLVISGRVVD